MPASSKKSMITDHYGNRAECLDFILVETPEQLQTVLQKYPQERIKVVGNLTNTILARRKLDCVVIKLGGEFSSLQLLDNQRVKAGSGVNLSHLLNFCLRHELGGLEFMVGIPGTVGGAVYCNAGAFGEQIGSYIQELICMDREGNSKRFKGKDIPFSYRSSGLGDFIILKAIIGLTPLPRIKIKDKMRIFFITRIQTQNYHNSGCGCFFKNTSRDSAGKIIEELGLKGRKRGGMEISLQHGNFLVCNGNVYPQDILALKDVIQRKVWREKKIWLEPEVEILW